MEKMKGRAQATAQLIGSPGAKEVLSVIGRYEVECFDKDGNLKWAEAFENHLATVGVNLMLDTFLAGSAYTVVGPFMGLISSVSFTITAITDTMSSHAGWTEAGPTNAPDYTGDRKTAVFSAAAAGVKALSAALAFTFSEGGTVEGCFVLTGTGAVNTHDDTNGVLVSSGVFTGGPRTVVNLDVLNVSYSLTIADT